MSIADLDAQTEQEAALVNAALGYAERGWSVIPLKPNDKHPAIREWKPFQKKQAEFDQIGSWFTRWPNANVGIITGEISKLLVLDLDHLEAITFAEKHGLPKTLKVHTAKGVHI